MKKFEKEAYGYIKDMFAQHNMVKRVVMTVISIIVMGFGIALFNVSGFGVDPFTSMNMNISSTLGIGYGTYQLIVNAVIIVFVVIVAHRGLIGVGTVINMVGVGYSCEFFSGLIAPHISNSLAVRICLLAAGIIVLCFSCSLFFVSNIGVGPYDSLSFMLSQFTHIHYKWLRVMTDIAVIIIGLVVSGGLTSLLKGDISGVKNIGIGTIMGAFYSVCSQVVITNLPLYNYYTSSYFSHTHSQSIERQRVLIQSGLLAIRHRRQFIAEHCPNREFYLERYKYMRWVCSVRNAIEAQLTYKEYLALLNAFRKEGAYPLSYKWIKYAGWDYAWRPYLKRVIRTFMVNHPWLGFPIGKMVYNVQNKG